MSTIALQGTLGNVEVTDDTPPEHFVKQRTYTLPGDVGAITIRQMKSGSLHITTQSAAVSTELGKVFHETHRSAEVDLTYKRPAEFHYTYLASQPEVMANPGISFDGFVERIEKNLNAIVEKSAPKVMASRAAFSLAESLGGLTHEDVATASLLKKLGDGQERLTDEERTAGEALVELLEKGPTDEKNAPKVMDPRAAFHFSEVALGGLTREQVVMVSLLKKLAGGEGQITSEESGAGNKLKELLSQAPVQARLTDNSPHPTWKKTKSAETSSRY